MRATDKTVNELSKFVMDSLTPESNEGLLKSLTPESLIISSFALTIASVAAESIYALIFLAATSLLIAVSLGINLRRFLIRAYGFVPAFTALIALPAAFSFITPGRPLLALPISSWGIYVTYEGVKATATLVLRVTASVSYLTLLTLKYGLSNLAEGLRKLNVPNEFINVLHFMLRYTLTLSKCLMDMIMAREARKLGDEGMIDYWRSWGEGLGAVQLKALKISEDIYMALKARGYGLGIDSGGARLKINSSLMLLTALVIAGAVVTSWVIH